MRTEPNARIVGHFGKRWISVDLCVVGEEKK